MLKRWLLALTGAIVVLLSTSWWVASGPETGAVAWPLRGNIPAAADLPDPDTATTGQAKPHEWRPSQTSRDPTERQLFAVLEAIIDGQLDTAIDRAQALLDQRPNFQLAHLVLADLYAIRAHGQIPTPAQRDGLDRELRQRLQAALTPPPPQHWPEALLAFDPLSPWAIVVDTDRSRLYLLQRPTAPDAAPTVVYDSFISIGKAGAGKRREGDNKTPLGVYDITGLKRDAELPDFYGAGALTLNYPNPVDRWHQRSGYGIWLHGTPSSQYARTPESSEGCVVLPNDHMQHLLTLTDIERAPVIIAQSIRWIPHTEQMARRQAVLDQLGRQWPALRASLPDAGLQVWRDQDGSQFARVSLRAPDATSAAAQVAVIRLDEGGGLTALTPEALAPWMPKQDTTASAAIAPGTEASPTGARGAPVKDERNEAVATALNQWAQAWSRRDVDAYLSHYAKDFCPPSGLSRQQWEAQRRQAILGRQRIRVQLHIQEIRIRDGVAIVKAIQRYEGDGKRLTTPKRFSLHLERGTWRIVEERTP